MNFATNTNINSKKILLDGVAIMRDFSSIKPLRFSSNDIKTFSAFLEFNSKKNNYKKLQK
jgi:hypothetical protein